MTETYWIINRYEISGRVTHRSIEGAIASKKKDGECQLSILLFKQEYIGGNYGKTEVDYICSTESMSCNNLK